MNERRCFEKLLNNPETDVYMTIFSNLFLIIIYPNTAFNDKNLTLICFCYITRAALYIKCI